MSSTPSSWSCPSCRQAVDTAFCPGCGERPLAPIDFTLKGIALQLLKVIAGVDGRLLRTLRLMLWQPGALTEAYVEGRRRPLFGPFQLFFLTNVAFFAIQSLTHTKIFSSSLDSHLRHQDWSDTAQALVARHLASTHDTLARFAPLFDQAVVLNAKSLIVLMVLPFALLLPLVFWRRHKPFAVHMAFALHQYAFLLLLFCAALVMVGLNVLAGGAGLEAALMDNLWTGINLLACASYLFLAIGRVYGGGMALRALQALGLTLAVGAIVLGYRFAIFLITLYTVSPP
ncbi:MAG: DUF3667 domain-containing protein [Burkholderiales bacterium]|nr:DUF3667 domain-containing protein [Burkholderiales bacterium]